MTDEQRQDKFTIRRAEDVGKLTRWLDSVRYNEVVEHLTDDTHTYELRYSGERTGAVVVHKIMHEHLRQIGVLL